MCLLIVVVCDIGGILKAVYYALYQFLFYQSILDEPNQRQAGCTSGLIVLDDLDVDGHLVAVRLGECSKVLVDVAIS